MTPKPDYELTSYEPVSITVPPLNFDDSLVDQQIQQLAESFATYEKCDAKPLDASGAAKIALEVSQGGKRLDNLCTDGRTYILGMGLMPDEFEKNLIGMTEGDVKEFAFDMPGAPEGEAPLDCKVTVLECQEKHVPEVDQAFIEKNMPMAATWSRFVRWFRSAAGRAACPVSGDAADHGGRRAVPSLPGHHLRRGI